MMLPSMSQRLHLFRRLGITSDPHFTIVSIFYTRKLRSVSLPLIMILSFACLGSVWVAQIMFLGSLRIRYVA